MNKTTTILLSLLALILTACGGNDDPEPTPRQITVSLQLCQPTGYTDATLSDLQLTLTDVNTGQSWQTALSPDDGGRCPVTAEAGYYRLSLVGMMGYRDEFNQEKKVEVRASSDGVTITQSGSTIALDLYVSSQPDPDPADIAYSGFVLAEIFCAGSATPQGSYYYADKYFVVYNNTDHVLYADSLAIAESDFLTVSKQNYSPDIMQSDFAVGALYMVPGSGRDVPVQPGERLLLVDNALNHTIANPNSWDETKADYEWYDESTNPQFTDVDNPNVPNLDRIYSKTLTMWSPHTQGFKAYALVRMKTDKRTFLADYTYNYAYHLVGQTGEADMTGNCYRVPNSWVVDAVNMSVPSMFQWIVTAPSLDRGWTYSSGFGWDDTRFNKSVRRKVSRVEGGRAVLQDTNNSTDDFEPRVTANPFHKFGTE